MQLCGTLNILWRYLSLGLEWKLTFSSPVATAEFSKFAGTLSAALSQHHLLGFEIAGIPSLPLALFVVILPKAHLTLYPWMSGSRWVITPSWLSGSWRSFLHNSFVYSCYLLDCLLLDLEKAEETEIKLPTSLNHQESKRVPEKHFLLLYWLCQSHWLSGSYHNRKFFKRWKYQTSLSVCRPRSNS